MKRNILRVCLIIALLEGFAGLGIEIYAIRISATYIGSSIAITGIILAMVLIAIAIGYWFGGKLSHSIDNSKQALIKAGFVLSLSAVSHAVACILQLPLLAAMTAASSNPIIGAVGVGLLYGVGLALGSTSIPLITQFLTLEYDNDAQVDAGRNAGMMVAITTVGSVLGSTLTPIVLLPYLGLMVSLSLFIVALALSALLCTMLAKHTKNQTDDRPYNIMAKNNYIFALIAVFGTGYFIATNKVDTGFQTATAAWFIDYFEYKGDKAVTISDNPKRTKSSCWVYATKTNCNYYGEITIEGINKALPSTLVFIGGAGMAIPSEVAYAQPNTRITIIDIDKDLPNIIEQHFLKSPIPENIEFIGDDARGYLTRNNDIQYDFMLIDAFQGEFVASNLYTTEALDNFKKSSTYIMANVIGRAKIDHGYTQTIFKNWIKTFGNSSYIVTSIENSDNLQNLILCNFACPNGKKLADASYINNNQKLHTDDLPTLERYYYQSI